MGMTIDEAITHIMDVICENNTIKHSDLVVFSDEKQALRTAIDTMRKYKKIAEAIDKVEEYICDIETDTVKAQGMAHALDIFEQTLGEIEDGDNN